MTPPEGVQATCSACGFTPWTPAPGALCERMGCDRPGSSWWHGGADLHWLVCYRHHQKVSA